MGEEPGQVREEIEETRSRMGETVEALAHKTDVRGRVSEYVGEKKEAITGRVGEKKDAITGRVSDAVPDSYAVRRRGRRAGQTARENPLGLGLAGLGAGFVLGVLLPTSRAEEERVGSVAGDLAERVRETGQQVVESGREVAKSAAASASETVREEAKSQGEELSSSLRESAEDVAAKARASAGGERQGA